MGNKYDMIIFDSDRTLCNTAYIQRCKENYKDVIKRIFDSDSK